MGQLPLLLLLSLWLVAAVDVATQRHERALAVTQAPNDVVVNKDGVRTGAHWCWDGTDTARLVPCAWCSSARSHSLASCRAGCSLSFGAAHQMRGGQVPLGAQSRGAG